MKDFQEEQRFLLESEVTRISNRILDAVKDNDTITTLQIVSWWNGELRWARNRVSVAADRRDIKIGLQRIINGSGGFVATNQTDDASLDALVKASERGARFGPANHATSMRLNPPSFDKITPATWSDFTYKVTSAEQSALARHLVEEAEDKGMLSAGYIEMRGAQTAAISKQFDKVSPLEYYTLTQSQCSMTVRHPKGKGSGWAGLSSFDWGAIDSVALSKTALDKCLRSLDPVAIEPGRYTVILEPQATADLWDVFFGFLNFRAQAEGQQQHPLFLEIDQNLQIGKSKLGLKIIDERISVSHQPMNAQLGVIPSEGMSNTEWIKDGVLNSISHDRSYSLAQLNKNDPDIARDSYVMSGGNASMEEMISSTKRGLIITRFSSIQLLQVRSVLCTGLTRDGLWLVENGKISKAVNNMRFTESPLFVFNQVEMLGKPTPVFRPVENPFHVDLSAAVVPSVKANDFSFTSMVDAV